MVPERPAGVPRDQSGVLRGGSWNNNPDNARASNRNRNHPDERNNNIGFRVVSSAHIPATAGSAGIADHGLRYAMAGASMAREHPVRTHCVGRISNLEHFGASVRSAPPFSFLPDPAAEQATEFSDLPAHVFILPVVQPAPMVCQPQIESKLVEPRIALQQALPAGAGRCLARAEQEFLEVECAVQQPANHAMAMDFRKGLALRDQPGQEVEAPREYYQVVMHGIDLLRH